MALATKIELRQGQQLVMTPQLQQAIRLLQLSNVELTQYVEAEMERNPLLERGEDGDQVGTLEPQAETDAGGGDETFADEPPDMVSAYHSTDADSRHEAIDADVSTVYPDASAAEIAAGEVSIAGAAGPDGLLWSGTKAITSSYDGSDGSEIEDYVAGTISLRDHLSSQVGLAFASATDRAVALYLIDMVDEAGYLRGDTGEVAEKLATDREHVERVLGVLQTFDPTGVCARSLSECLALQLREQNRYDPIIAKVLENLQLIAQHNLSALRRAVGVEESELREMILELRSLNPKPGLAYGTSPIEPVVPDVLVRPARDGGWTVELNAETLPRVLVNRSYQAIVTRKTCSEGDRAYLMDCLNNANWLVKSLDQRARTILRVAEEIVRLQDAFLAHGVQHLRPLNLKTVADRIKMHESTVSRVTSNKYMATPRGIFELKYFFTSALAAADGGEASHSSESVRHRIRTMIDAEQPDDILSDDRIVERLKSDGIEIARRTVAKYREALHISSSVQRRREKLAAQRLLKIS